MQPNTPQQPQYSMDYLDSIATQQPVKTMNPLVLWGIIGGVLVLAIVVVMSILSGGSSSTDTLTSFAARVVALKETSEDSQGKLQSSNLRTLNSNLTLVMTNANKDLEGPLAAQKIKLDNKKNKNISLVAIETEKLNGRLEDARLNAVFDRTYAREVAFSLKTMRSDMSELYNATRSKPLKSTLVKIDNNVKPLQESFSAFNAN